MDFVKVLTELCGYMNDGCDGRDGYWGVYGIVKNPLLDEHQKHILRHWCHGHTDHVTCEMLDAYLGFIFRVTFRDCGGMECQ